MDFYGTDMAYAINVGNLRSAQKTAHTVRELVRQKERMVASPLLRYESVTSQRRRATLGVRIELLSAINESQSGLYRSSWEHVRSGREMFRKLQSLHPILTHGSDRDAIEFAFLRVALYDEVRGALPRQYLEADWSELHKLILSNPPSQKLALPLYRFVDATLAVQRRLERGENLSNDELIAASDATWALLKGYKAVNADGEGRFFWQWGRFWCPLLLTRSRAPGVTAAERLRLSQAISRALQTAQLFSDDACGLTVDEALPEFYAGLFDAILDLTQTLQVLGDYPRCRVDLARGKVVLSGAQVMLDTMYNHYTLERKGHLPKYSPDFTLLKKMGFSFPPLGNCPRRTRIWRLGAA